MKNLKTKIAVGLATAGVLVATMAPAAFAANSISGTGAFSYNKIKTSNNCTVGVGQVNTTSVTTVVNQGGKTGKNSNNFNVGGSQSTTTGAVTNTAGVSVVTGDNTANVANPCCGCGLLVGEDVLGGNSITGTGAFSKNVIKTSNNQTTSVSQQNTTSVTTVVNQSGSTGGNSNSFNVGTGSTTNSGEVSNTTGVEVTGGSNSVTL